STLHASKAVEARGVRGMRDQSTSGTLLHPLRILFKSGTAVGLTDRALLERFVDPERAQADDAFEALVERHGPMVLRVCNQFLRDRHAAEDAFQATFLVLAQRAQTIRKRDSLESWLFGVACRAAAQIRMMESRRQRFEHRGALARVRAQACSTDPADRWPEL